MNNWSPRQISLWGNMSGETKVKHCLAVAEWPSLKVVLLVYRPLVLGLTVMFIAGLVV